MNFGAHVLNSNLHSYKLEHKQAGYITGWWGIFLNSFSRNPFENGFTLYDLFDKMDDTPDDKMQKIIDNRQKDKGNATTY